ncbi:MAG: glutathione S-transferase family protein [bacterium]|nr:glutathione S-transferase family protein [bacterium]
MIVHGSTASPFVRKVCTLLAEKGVPYERRDLVPVPKTPALLAKHPLGKIPILELDDGTYVPDSSVIALYLERIQPAPAMYPADAKEYARALFLEEYADTRIFDVAGGLLVERFVKPRLFGQPADERRVAAILAEELPAVCDWLEPQVHPERDTLLPAFGIADAAIDAHLGVLPVVGEGVDPQRWPRLARYLDRLWARPSFQATAPG